MNRIEIKVLLLLVIIFGLSTTKTLAQQPLMGRWIFNLRIERDGRQVEGEVPFLFTSRNRGHIEGIKFSGMPRLNTPFTYTEMDKKFSISYSYESSMSGGLADGFPSAIFIIRGTRITDKVIEGDILVVTD